ncbi:alpha/beta hydrolase [Psittacicella gerlachiana]|uniref:Alpha/beta hydrolase n=1 Tax=Psittacicella gerlachiana TaxID=2028574 RepID=A0A3A1Y9W2_9GAMM|nr:alpha/beta hydrolase [Psittacicella gerlachiana]RIY32907.1 alpha/beta hydrolase [Psittacicella gerlachiana]
MADYKLNPFTLVYDQAITENKAHAVNIKPVSYDLNGLKIAANVYTPADYDPQQTYAAIVVAHPNGGVKEQVAGLYAQKLAEQGYITIAFDAAYQGGSEGLPRYVDRPANRIEDIRRAADFISTFPGVDPQRLGVLGICGGGGYTIKAAQSDKRFKAVATLSMFNSGLVRRNGFQNSQLDTIQQRLEQASQAREEFVRTGKAVYSPAFANKLTAQELEALPFDLYRDGYFYYGVDYAHPNSQTNFTLDSLLDLMTFDVNTNVNLINQPLLMVAGEQADTRYMTEEVFAQATGTTNKELFLIPGARHIQTYFKPEYVAQAMQKYTEFFAKYL